MSSLTPRFKQLFVIVSLFLLPLVIIFFALPGKATESDAIAVRVLPNLEHDSVEVWYQKQGYQGSPQSLIVDGYEAIRDDRTVFVNAANLDLNTKKIYTNVYLISYNQESGNKTQDVLGQLISHWKFNNNLPEKGFCVLSSLSCSQSQECPEKFRCIEDSNDPNYGRCSLIEPGECLIDGDCPLNSYCNSLKAALIRDTSRLGRLKQIENKLELYKNEKGSYPALETGSYLSGVTMSVWPSWANNFREALKINILPTDPINSLGACPGFEAETCWDPKNNVFYNSELSLPAGSYALIYQALPKGTNYNLCATFETFSLGYDIADGTLAFKNCQSEKLYQEGTTNTAPILLNSYLKGEAKKKFSGYIRAMDPEGDAFSWQLVPANPADFHSWSNVPVLEATSDPLQKKISASVAGNEGVYPMILTLRDIRGGIKTETIPLEIIDRLGAFVEIDANNATFKYYSDSATGEYTFFINSSANSLFYLKSADPSFNDILSEAVSRALVSGEPNNKKITLTFPLVGLEGEKEFTIHAQYGSRADAKKVSFTFIPDIFQLNPANCSDQARIGKAYPIDGSQCVLGPVELGGKKVNYFVATNNFNLTTNKDNQYAYLKSEAIKNGEINSPHSSSSATLILSAVSSLWTPIITESFSLDINTFCGDGIKQEPNSEGTGGPNNDGNEQCDGLSGLASSVAASSPFAQYACTTAPEENTPYPINNNNYCVFKNSVSGGGYCGDGYCQETLKGKSVESCSNCPQDCGECVNCGTLTDYRDGKTYNTVMIAGKCWMAENLNVGEPLHYSMRPTSTDGVIQKWCYDGDPSNCDNYGGLYTWDEAMQGSETPGAQGICPGGWHIPTDDEIYLLERTVLNIINATIPPYNTIPDSNCYQTITGWCCAERVIVGDNSVDGSLGVGKSLKALGVGSGVGTGDNLVGFNAKLSGVFASDGHSNMYFTDLGKSFNFWLSTPYGGFSGGARTLEEDRSSIYRWPNGAAREQGLSVRCVRDY